MIILTNKTIKYCFIKIFLFSFIRILLLTILLVLRPFPPAKTITGFSFNKKLFEISCFFFTI